MTSTHHGHDHDHDHGHNHDHQHPKSTGKWQPHTDWRVWAVVLMLAAMVIYTFTMYESFLPGGGGPALPVPETAQ